MENMKSSRKIKRARKVGKVSLVRKVRRIGNSLTIAIPSQLAEMMGVRAGDHVEYDYLGEGVLKIKTLRFKRGKREDD